ncbi:hypothetical protein K4K60_001362 [Colletotrichum sp. SAR11_57]|nr:hypothetical protein K4K60_001362 [Colletotrichum sp. SAR11_57]
MVIGLLTIAAIPTVIGTGQAVSAQKKQNAAAKEQAKFSLTATMTIDGKQEEAPCVLVDNKASLSSFFATLLRVISSIICKTVNMSSPREKNNTKYASDEETSEDTQQQEQPQRRQRRQGNRQMQRRQQGGPLGGLGGGNPTEAVQGVTGGVQNTLGNVAGGALQQGGGGGDKSDTLRLRLDLNLDIEITLKARIHGDLELALL